MPKYSVLIPVYNSEKYLAECFDSVLSQTYSDFEIIAVDDGSTDSSGKICDEYAAKDSRIHVVHKQNGGVYRARKTAFENSHGEYIFTFDCDDLIDRNLIKTVNEKIDVLGCDLVLYDLGLFFEDSSKNYDKAMLPNDRPLSSDDKKELYLLLLGRKMNSLCTKCCSRKIYEQGFLYDGLLNLCHGEDWFQSATMLHGMTKGYYIKSPMYRYRIIESSLSHRYDTESFMLNSVSLQIVRKLMLDDGCFDEEAERKWRAYGRMVMNTFLLAVSESDVPEKEKLKTIKSIENTDIYKISVEKAADYGSTKMTKLKFFLIKHRLYKTLLRLMKARQA